MVGPQQLTAIAADATDRASSSQGTPAERFLLCLFLPPPLSLEPETTTLPFPPPYVSLYITCIAK